MAANVDERALEAAMPRAAPDELAVALARAKALSAEAPGALVIGADQVLSLDGRIFHKSATREEALITLSSALRPHPPPDLGLRDWRATAKSLEAGAETADMTMRALDGRALSLYLDAAGPVVLGSVGVYQWEGSGRASVRAGRGRPLDHSWPADAEAAGGSAPARRVEALKR